MFDFDEMTERMREMVEDVEVLENNRNALAVKVKTKVSNFRLFFLRDDFLGEARMTCFTDKPNPEENPAEAIAYDHFKKLEDWGFAEDRGNFIQVFERKAVDKAYWEYDYILDRIDNPKAF